MKYLFLAIAAWWMIGCGHRVKESATGMYYMFPYPSDLSANGVHNPHLYRLDSSEARTMISVAKRLGQTAWKSKDGITWEEIYKPRVIEFNLIHDSAKGWRQDTSHFRVGQITRLPDSVKPKQ